MDAWRQNTSVVSKLRIAGGGSDALATRLQFERLFGAGDFLPSSLPPAAIVCIKHLRDPAPRSLRLNRFDAARTNAWKNSVAREIETLYGRAFRPIREAVPAQAESVVFADKTELLACLASDWCDGFLSERWWWRGLFPDLQVAKTWLEAAEFAPAALQLLARQKKAAEFVAQLQPHEAAELLRRIIRVFNLDKLQDALFEPPEKEKPRTLPVEISEAKQFPRTEDFFAAAHFAPRLAPEAETNTSDFERQSLIAVGLTLARSPSVARSTEFAREMKIFRVGFEARKIQADKISKRKRTTERRKKKTAFLRGETIPPKVLDERRKFFEDFAGEAKKPSKPVVSTDKPKRKSPKKKRGDSEKITFETASEKEFAPSPDEKKLEPPPPEIKFEDTRREKEFKPPRAKTEFKPREKETKPDRFEKAIETFTDFEEETGIVVETSCGGVFYLLNLALYLKLYRDFTEAPEPEIDLNIWDLVALLGREFLGKKIENDPVWKLLANLAGRENDDEPGKDFAPTSEWRMPREWLETFPTMRKWRRINTGERLIVRHPAGFNVVDVPFSAAENALEDELKVYGKNISALARSRSTNVGKYSLPAENWLKNLFEYVRARLFRALNCRTQKEINAVLFERKASISVTATHLEVAFNLADIAFEVRLSGLDCNPGWIPAAGKFVYFHFV